MDVLYLGLVAVFTAAVIGMAAACARLGGKS
jgi:hypothetical protein